MLESLISINNKLQQKEAAAGLLEYAMKKHEGEIRVQERWHEKLHDWERALDAYRKKEVRARSNYLGILPMGRQANSRSLDNPLTRTRIEDLIDGTHHLLKLDPVSSVIQ